MKAEINISYNQILDLIKQLPRSKKIELSEELEKDVIESQLKKLLVEFRTDELSLDDLNKEVELVRQNIYDKGGLRN